MISLEVSMEPSSPLPASSMAGKKQPPPPLAVVVDVDVDAELSPPSPASSASMDKKKDPPVVVLVCLWALFNAVIFAIDELITNRNSCTTHVELTEAAAAEASALWRWQLWCAALQAAAAALALVFEACGRSRWGAGDLALVALVATAASHYMEGSVDRIFHAAAPGDAYVAFDVGMSRVLGVIDLIYFFCLEIFTLDDGGGEQ